jgi:hypothetical protein
MVLDKKPCRIACHKKWTSCLREKLTFQSLINKQRKKARKKVKANCNFKLLPTLFENMKRYKGRKITRHLYCTVYCTMHVSENVEFTKFLPVIITPSPCRIEV